MPAPRVRSRGFIDYQRKLGATFDPSLASTKEHAAALRDLETAFGAAYGPSDRVLSDRDLVGLHHGMENTTAAAADAYVDTQLGTDPGIFDPSKAKSATEIVEGGNEAAAQATSTDENFGAGDREIKRADDGRIVYDGAPDFAEIRAGEAQLGLGHKSEEVRDVQRALFEGGHFDGLYPDGTEVDGVADNFYGPKTTEAVRRWQEANGFDQTGELDGAQLDALTKGTSVDNTIRNGQDRVIATDVATASAVAVDGERTHYSAKASAGDSMATGIDAGFEVTGQHLCRR